MNDASTLYSALPGTPGLWLATTRSTQRLPDHGENRSNGRTKIIRPVGSRCVKPPRQRGGTADGRRLG
jgi:hypothetical protein